MPEDISLQQYQKLTSLIFAAAIDQNKWSDFLRELSVASGGVYTFLWGHDMKTGLLNKAVHQYQDDFVRSYEDYYGDLNAWIPGLFANSVGAPICAELLIPRESLQKTEFYNDWVRPQEDITGGGGALLHKDDSRFFVFGGNIRAKDSEKLEPGWMKLVELLTPSLQHAFEISRMLGGLDLEKAITEQSTIGKSTAIAVLNSSGKIIYSNPLTQSMLEQGGLIRSDISGKLGFCRLRSAEILKRMLTFLETPDAALSSTFPTENLAGTATYMCRTTRFDPSGMNFSPLGDGFGYGQPCLLLTITRIDYNPNIIGLLSNTYGLTPAEASAALELTDGKSLRSISEEKRISVHTTRNQIKSAMSKTGKQRQSDLVRLVEQMRIYWQRD